MVTRNPSQDARAVKVFRKKKVLMIEELSGLLGSSFVTARRRLKQWKAYTSYNQNGRYYVLPDIAKFNTYGLWRHQDILFSQHGNLKKTVIALIKNSSAGLTGSQIGNLVSLAPRSFLSHFRTESQLRREMIEGRFVYFASDKATCIQQKKNLQEQTNPSDMRAPTDAEAVVVLVERIKHSGLSIEDLAKKLRKVGYRFSAEVIRHFLDSHGLLKKTQAIASSGR
jgi:hypothetical protein